MRLLRRTLIAMLVIVALAALAALLWLQSTVPADRGTALVAALHDSSLVVFDSLGIPTVTAASEADLYAALGYLHARDRFFQMDLMRRAAEGRLAELFGRRAVVADRAARDWELGALAQRADRTTPAGLKRLLDAYTSGVNAWLAEGESSLEHRLLRLPAKSWRNEDTYAILLLEAKQLHNLGDERLRANAVRLYGPGADSLMAPGWPVGAPVVIETRDEGRESRDERQTPNGERGTAHPASLVPRPSSTKGSNSWVIAGSRTASGLPLLANDPHLPLGVPSIWYLAVLHAPGIDAEGASIPGVPGIVIGRNRDIAWGMTASYVDDADEVLEEFSPDTMRVRRPGGWAPVVVVAETLRVKNDSALIYQRRRTSNGPIVHWIAGTPLTGIVRRWSGQDATPGGLLASLGLVKARDWSSFRAALADVKAPTLGMTYADRGGHIGYTVAGGIPVRSSSAFGASGPGSTVDSAWHGYVKPGEVPFALDGAPFFVTSNNRIIDDTYPYFLSTAWASPYRAERIQAMLMADSSVSVADAAMMQMDVGSVFAKRMKAVAARAALSAGDSAAAAMLDRWDGSMRADLAAPTLFWRWNEAVRTELRRLPSASPSSWAAQHRWMRSDTIRLADGRVMAFDTISVSAMRAAVDDPRARWLWGRAHRLIERHPLGEVPVLGRLLQLNLGPVEAPGGDYTVNLCTSGGDTIPWTCTEGPSMRFIADLGSDAGAWFVLPAGQSGNPRSPHYRDQFPLWREGKLAWLGLASPQAVISQGGLWLVPRR
ncbi:MAG TPA: penicillin acylase family protein [Gemmatimonadales bacterium]|jgi:penicillin amidase|nr:penicillin acylase family protein [Gemmatimonadales bacterium]